MFSRVRSQKREVRILAAMPESELPTKKSRLPSGLPPYLASLYEVPLLTRKQEAHLFRKMNYLKYKAARFRAKLDPARPKRAIMDRIDRLYDEAVATKNQIIRANLRLVVSIAKRHVGPTQNFFELVSDGNMSLMRAVEKFDYARGNKFSTYASWAIMKNFARTIPDEHRHHDRFRTSQAELFTTTEDDRADPIEEETAQTQREAQVEENPGTPRRTRAADHHSTVRPATRPGAANAQASRGRVGRDQGAGPPNRGPGAQQAPQGSRGREDRAAELAKRGHSTFSAIAGLVSCLFCQK